MVFRLQIEQTQIDQCVADEGEALQPVDWQMEEVQIPLVHRFSLSQWLRVGRKRHRAAKGTKESRKRTWVFIMTRLSRLRIRVWDKFKETWLGFRPASKRLRVLQELFTCPRVDCELNGNTRSSSRKGALGTMFGRRSPLKRTTGRQRDQALSSTSSRNSAMNHGKMKETSAACLGQEHKD